MEILEAPIVHGRISVNNIVSNVITFSDGSTINNIDTALDHNSSNPLSNNILATTINNITSPPLDNFNVHLVMNPSASHTSGTIIFPTRNVLVNDFSSGGPDLFNSTITIPIKGTYSIFFQTTAYNSGESLSVNLVLDGQSLTSVLGTGRVSFSTTMILSAASQISLNSNNSTSARSELNICLIKRDHTLPGA